MAVANIFSVNISLSSFAAVHLTRSLESVGVFSMTHSLFFPNKVYK